MVCCSSDLSAWSLALLLRASHVSAAQEEADDVCMDDAMFAEAAERDHFRGLLQKAGLDGGRDASVNDSDWALAAHYQDAESLTGEEDDEASFINQQPNSMLLAPVRLCCFSPVAFLPCVTAVGLTLQCLAVYC